MSVLKNETQKQEPVAWIYEFYADMGHKGLDFEEQRYAYNTPLYTSPPQRQPLEDFEIRKKWSETLADTEGETKLPLIEFARAIEAAHGIKESDNG